MDEVQVAEKFAVHTKEMETLLAQLINANRELAFQNVEKEKRAAELLIANGELAFENFEKGKRAEELVIANKELIYQNKEREERAAELVLANEELAFQNEEKEKRASELIIANKELIYQNGQKEERAAELIIANKELAIQYEEKEKRASELITANKELAFQNEEKEKRAAELVILNKELLTFTYISNHDLQEPLRKIQVYVSRILQGEYDALSPAAKNYFQRIEVAAERMKEYIRDLLLYQYASSAEYKFEKISLAAIVNEVKNDLAEIIEDKKAVIAFNDSCYVNTMFVSFRQLLYNIIHNALKFSKPGIPPYIVITASSVESSVLDTGAVNIWKKYCHIVIQDNGIGFEPEFSDRIFEIFQRLHSKEEYPGTGIGLAIAKKIVGFHKGAITARSEPGKGTTVDIYIPE